MPHERSKSKKRVSKPSTALLYSNLSLLNRIKHNGGTFPLQLRRTASRKLSVETVPSSPRCFTNVRTQEKVNKTNYATIKSHDFPRTHVRTHARTHARTFPCTTSETHSDQNVPTYIKSNHYIHIKILNILHPRERRERDRYSRRERRTKDDKAQYTSATSKYVQGVQYGPPYAQYLSCVVLSCCRAVVLSCCRT